MVEIAIDGTAASGKGTLAKSLSLKYGYPFLDTGLMYRKIAFEIINKQINTLEDIEKISCELASNFDFSGTQDQDLRSEKTAALASSIAAYPKLRNILNEKQLEFNYLSKQKYGGCILDGRDIGTIILPNADFKFFVDAPVEIRAKRRLLEKNISFLHENDEKCMLQSLIKHMIKRDKLDTNRTTSPLVRSKDAHQIDTSFLNPNEVLALAVSIIEGKNK